MSDVCKHGRCTRNAYAYGGYCHRHAYALGLAHHLQPVEQAQRIIDTALSKGWTLTAIADASGLHRSGLKLIRNGTRTEVEHRTLTRLKALDLDGERDTKQPMWPTARRVQSLLQAGHSSYQIAERAGVSPASVTAIARHRTTLVWKDTAERIDRVWLALYSQPVGKPSKAAKGKQWVPPMWWDDIDDPDEQPGVSHCTVCHRPLKTARSPLCKPCRKAEYRAENPELIKAQSTEYYRRKKAERNAA